MFCKYCGEQTPDNAVFCKKCGGKLIDEKKIERNNERLVMNSSTRHKTGFKIRPSIVVIVAVVLVLIIALSQLLGGRNYKKTVDIFFEAVLDGDGKEILKTLPDEMIEYLMEEEGFDSREEAEEELEDSIGNPKELLDNAYGDDWTYKYEIVNAEEYSSDELETLKETYQEEIPDIKIKDAKKVTLKLTIEAEEIGEQSNTIDLSVIKIGKKWYKKTYFFGGQINYAENKTWNNNKRFSSSNISHMFIWRIYSGNYIDGICTYGRRK